MMNLPVHKITGTKLTPAQALTPAHVRLNPEEVSPKKLQTIDTVMRRPPPFVHLTTSRPEPPQDSSDCPELEQPYDVVENIPSCEKKLKFVFAEGGGSLEETDL